MVTAWWSDVPGTRVEEHVHPFPECRGVLSGFLGVHVGGEVFELGPGDRLDLARERLTPSKCWASHRRFTSPAPTTRPSNQRPPPRKRSPSMAGRRPRIAEGLARDG